MPTHASLTQEAALRQRTTLTPLQIQEIRILEYPTLELEQRIEREVEENPGLEVGSEPNEENEFDEPQEDALQNDDFDLDDYISDDDTPDYMLRQHNASPDDKREDIPFAAGESFQEFLNSQLGMLKLDKQDLQVAQYVLGNIDEDGYLRRDAQSLVDDLVFKANIDVSDEKMSSIIAMIQNTFEPAGVCAADLQECLLLQLKRKPQTDAVQLAQLIINKRFKDFTSHHYNKIIDRYSLSQEQMKAAIQEITKLNPKPGSAFSNDYLGTNAIIPDFIIEVSDNQVYVSLNNGNIPELRINRDFDEMMRNYQSRPTHTKQERDAIAFIKDRIDSARWFIDAIEQRNATLLSTMRAIVKLQKPFFLDGDEALLKPMILKDVADLTGYDVSTISRVGNSKYAQTPYGIYPLKFFFSESMLNEEGEEVATRAIKNAMLDIVNSEDKRDPINDDDMVDRLKEKGFPIARRTVAKYRKQLKIPVARLRKQI
mgnify:CR=1 FL=1